ncbi:MFS transporter [Streptomyces sp. G-G2]|uniref:MFS transporter n=1 Tax=Streptomyces sp. G-G2 TaxID=3046201 RepID=UPI0024BA49A3|nr:MFS transporter [Streptomyces sp. G-G2]MDJ0381541.1 MFS transporter [Streptomyces sp. G-G2]
MSPTPDALAALRRRSVNRILVLHGLSSFCYGMVFPFIGIHLAARPEIGTAGVAVYYGASGLSNLAVSLLLTAAAVRIPRHALAILGLFLWIGCFGVLTGATTLPEAGAAALLGGAGQGAFMAAIIPIVNSLVPPEERRAVFARRYQILNATLAGGSLVAGLFLAVFSREAITWLLLVNAAGYLPVALVLALARKVPGIADTAAPDTAAPGTAAPDGAATEADRPAPAPAFGTGMLIRASLTAALFQFGAYLFGFSQFEATAPLVADQLMDTGIGWISVMLTVNVVVIVACQRPLGKLLEKHPEERGLRVAVAFWVTGFLFAFGTAFGPGPVQLTGLILYAAFFGLGECAYSCSFHPWLISKVPDRELTRASALCNSMMGIGMFFGPSAGIALIGLGDPVWVWLPLAALCGLVALTTLRRGARTASAATADSGAAELVPAG